MSSKPTVTDEGQRNDQAWRAIYEYMQRSLVFIVDGPPNEHKVGKGHGSGTLVRTLGGRTIVLTASHVLRDPTRSYSLGGYFLGNGAVAEPFAGVWKHPGGEDGVDVAVARLSEEATTAFAAGAITLAQVADASVEHGEQEPTVICGFPAALRTQNVDHSQKVTFQGYASMAYNTRVVGFDLKRGRYEMAWDEGVTDREDTDGLLKVFGYEPGKVFKQPPPGGISGGPLWRLSPVKKDTLWAANKAATIIGVCESWDEERVQYCPSVRVWGDWFRETLAEIDAAS